MVTSALEILRGEEVGWEGLGKKVPLRNVTVHAVMGGMSGLFQSTVV